MFTRFVCLFVPVYECLCVFVCSFSSPFFLFLLYFLLLLLLVCTSKALSVNTRVHPVLYIGLLLPLSSTHPHCSSAISRFILFPILVIIMANNIFMQSRRSPNPGSVNEQGNASVNHVAPCWRIQETPAI